MFIAEIGINHHGDVNNALDLVKAASDAKCDGVKMQYRGLDFYHAMDEIGDEILEHEINKNRLTHLEIQKVSEFARSVGLQVGMSVFRLADAAELVALNFEFDFWKVPSTECENVPLVNYLIDLGTEVFISSGGADLNLLARIHQTEFEIFKCYALCSQLPSFEWISGIWMYQDFAAAGMENSGLFLT